MASILTEVYISLDGLEYVKLDLYKSESIPMKYTQKDLQDVSKIFSPYSQSFTFPATPRNRRAFGFFGDTEVYKTIIDNKYACKIYTDGALNLTGFIVLKDLKYRLGNAIEFSGNFATSMTNLKDRIGDALISDLALEPVEIEWVPGNVFNLMKGASNRTIRGSQVNMSYFVPLISINRVWSYDQNTASPLKDNIAYDYNNSPIDINLIKSSEVRACISFSSIIELIKLNYNLSVICPLDYRREYKDLMVWCNSENLYSPSEKKITLKNNFGPLYFYDSENENDIGDPKKYVATANLTDSSINVLLQDNSDLYFEKAFRLRIAFDNILITGNSENPTVNIRIVRKGTLETLIAKQFELDVASNQFIGDIIVSDNFFISNNIEFFIFAQFNQPTTWTNFYTSVAFKFYDGKFGTFNEKRYATYESNISVNNNSIDVAGTKIDLFKSLPPIKVIDFLTSYFKMFNISVYDTSPNNQDLFWLTPSDIQTSGLVYSKAVLDYTRFVDIQEFTKTTATPYNYYNFKHATSKYISNVDYLDQFGLEYAQATEPTIKPNLPIEFKVETNFSLMVPVVVNGTADVVTYYGFTKDTPEILGTGESRYKPNYGELTIFYNTGNTPLTTTFGVQSQSSTGSVINAELKSYMKVLPFNVESNSIGFSILKFLNIEYPVNLFLKHYANQTIRLLNPNVLSQAYSFTLPSSEMFLNESTTIQGSGATPTGFRLQNEIIIGETRFTILDATIDITTGKSKMNLLNIVNNLPAPTEDGDPPVEPPFEPVATVYYYRGIYKESNQAHPRGGSVVYIDADDMMQIYDDLYFEYCVPITAKSIISTSYAVPCTP